MKAILLSLLVICLANSASAESFRITDLPKEIEACKAQTSHQKLSEALYGNYLGDAAEHTAGRQRWKEAKGIWMAVTPGYAGMSYKRAISASTINQLDSQKMLEAYSSAADAEYALVPTGMIDGFALNELFPGATKMFAFCDTTTLMPKNSTTSKMVRTFAKTQLLGFDTPQGAMLHYKIEQDQHDRELFQATDAWMITPDHRFVQLIGDDTRF